jgi:peptidoglycan/LPS O-acetylase OafA/YrhL
MSFFLKPRVQPCPGDGRSVSRPSFMRRCRYGLSGSVIFRGRGCSFWSVSLFYLWSLWSSGDGPIRSSQGSTPIGSVSSDEKVCAFIRGKVANILSVLAIGLTLCSLPFLSVVYPVKAHFYCCLFMLLALMLSAHPWKVFVNPVSVFIGRISYSLYIFHFAVMTWLYSFFPSQFPQLPAQRYLYFFVFMLATVLMSIPAAWCGYQFIERPAIDLSKRLITRLELKRSA